MRQHLSMPLFAHWTMQFGLTPHNLATWPVLSALGDAMNVLIKSWQLAGLDTGSPFTWITIPDGSLCHLSFFGTGALVSVDRLTDYSCSLHLTVSFHAATAETYCAD
mgnify:CR=1 FL=1